jgi:hypothetical protein
MDIEKRINKFSVDRNILLPMRRIISGLAKINTPIIGRINRKVICPTFISNLEKSELLYLEL